MASSTPTSTPTLWDGRYTTTGSKAVSWFQAVPEPSLELVTGAESRRDAAIVDIGGGASVLSDHLLAAGYANITVMDISRVALDELAARLPPGSVKTVCADLRTWEPADSFQLWHDRAVYHFLTDPEDQARYWRMVRAHLVPGGHVVIGTFAEDGPEKCSGLVIQRYSAASLTAAMGEGFEVEKTLRHVHTTPSGGSQAFTWVVARRTDA